MPHRLLVLLLFSCVARAASPDPLVDGSGQSEAGRVGLTYEQSPEGLVVTSVVSGAGAQGAGIGVGDLIVAIDGVPVTGQEGGARILGPEGSRVELRLRGPWNGPERTVGVTRSVLRLAPPPSLERLPPEVVAFRRALAQNRVGPVRKASRELVAADFGGISPARAIGDSLLTAAQRSPRLARAAIEELSLTRQDEALLHLRLGLALEELGQTELAAGELLAVEALRPPDLMAAEGERSTGDLGGNRDGRTSLARTLWALGHNEQAIAVARSLAQSHDVPELRARVGLAQELPVEAWKAQLPAAPDLRLELLDGTPWSLQDHRGGVVLLSYWATWCGPCKEELPELKRLFGEQQAAGLTVIAISLDEARDRPAVDRFVERAGFPFPVAHAPGLGERLGVEALPSLRLVGRDGALRYAGRGYSPAAFRVVEAQVAAALEDVEGAGAVVASPRSARGQASLRTMVGAPGAGRVAAGPGGVVLTATHGAPRAWAAGPDGRIALDGVPELDQSAPAQEPGLAAWGDTLTTVREGGLRIESWTREGQARWELRTDSPVRALSADRGFAWVATDNGVVTLDLEGRVLSRYPVVARDLVATEGGAWAVDGRRRLWLQDGQVHDRGAAPSGTRVDRRGAVAGPVAVDLVLGRFGPDGALRSVAAREDGAVVALDGAGLPCWRLQFDGSPDLAVADLEGDGHDELLAVVPGQGLLVIDLSLP